MEWMWNNIIVPIFRHTWYLIKVVFRWAYNNPVAGMVVGAALLGGSLVFWLSDDDVLSSLCASWGISLLITGAIGYVLGSSYFDTLMRGLANIGISGPEGF